MFNKGNVIICKSIFQDSTFFGDTKLTIDKNYIIIEKYNSINGTWVTLEDDTGNIKDLNLQEMNHLFYTIQELRKLKLNKIQKNV